MTWQNGSNGKTITYVWLVTKSCISLLVYDNRLLLWYDIFNDCLFQKLNAKVSCSPLLNYVQTISMMWNYSSQQSKPTYFSSALNNFHMARSIIFVVVWNNVHTTRILIFVLFETTSIWQGLYFFWLVRSLTTFKVW